MLFQQDFRFGEFPSESHQFFNSKRPTVVAI
jgi:hypothetical protein